MIIDDTVKEFLQAAAYAMVPVRLKMGEEEQSIFIVKSSGDVLREIRDMGSEARIAWVVRRTDCGPVFCAILDASAGPTARLTVEAYFDPFEDGDNDMLGSFALQEKLRAAFFDEEMELVGLVGVKWGEIERLALEQAIDWAGQLAEDAVAEGVELDFERACDIFRSETTIERLAGKYFPDTSN